MFNPYDRKQAEQDARDEKQAERDARNPIQIGRCFFTPDGMRVIDKVQPFRGFDWEHQPDTRTVKSGQHWYTLTPQHVI